MTDTSQPTPFLSVVVPAKNEAENIRPLVAELQQALEGRYDYELVYVDDGSTDATLPTLRAIQAEGFGRLKVLCHARSTGQSFAVLSGARAARGTWLAVLDADGQNDPADLPGMIEGLLEAHGADTKVVGVIGHRVNRRDDLVKRPSSRIANAYSNALLKDGVPDVGCGLKVVRRDWYLRLPAFDHMHRYIPTLVQAFGGRMTVHPVNHRPRVAGVSKYGVWNRLWVGLVDVLGVWWLKRRAKVAELREPVA